MHIKKQKIKKIWKNFMRDLQNSRFRIILVKVHGKSLRSWGGQVAN